MQKPHDVEDEGWVSSMATQDLIALAHRHDAPIDVLLSGLNADEATLTDPTARISWEDFLQLWRNASTIWNDEELVGLGRELIELDTFRPFVDSALALGNPIECLRLISAMVQQQLMSCIEHEFEQQSPDKCCVGMRMSEGYQPCPQYFLLNKGFYEALPTIYGYPMASVEMISTASGAEWKISISSPTDPRATVRNLFRRLGGLFKSRARLLEARENLTHSNDAMRRRVQELDSKLEALQKIEERFIKIFRSAPSPMLISRISNMSVVYVNESLLALTGYSREVVMGWGKEDLSVWISVEERDSVQATVQDEGSSIVGREIRLRHKEGHELVALLSSRPVDLSGEPCILWQATDITARKKTERKLAKYRDHLEELVAERTRELERSLKSMQDVERLASIGTLAAGVAHQINNPIASIRAASEYALLCDDQPDAVATYREALENCVEQSDRCGLIVRNILRFSRGETGVRSHLDLRQLIIDSCQLVASFADENGATIEIDAGESELPVWVNSIEIEQVFVNVLRNAIESGDGKTRVEVRARRLDTGAFVEIRDDGVGIEPAHLPFLFDPFYTTRLERGGTGLGLSVAHGIVTAHGGAIRAETEVDQGTAIQIQLPLAEDEPSQLQLVPDS